MSKKKHPLENTAYGKTTPINWRLFGDLCLLLIPAIDGIVAAAPNLEHTQKYWVAGGLSIGLIVVKFLTDMVSKKE